MKTGVQCFYNYLKLLDSGFRRNDDHEAFPTFYDFIRYDPLDLEKTRKNIELGKHLLIDSTPTLVLQNGKIIEGYAPMGTLNDVFKSMPGL